MYKSIAFHGTLNERTGYGVHTSRFTEQLSKLIPVNINGEGEVHVSLLDVVTAAHTTVRHPYPSILYTVWESTEYPAEFMDKLKLYDQLWVPSEAQKAWSVSQGVPEEFVKVVPEGVNPKVFAPSIPDDCMPPPATFDFLHVGQWQPRKSTREICEAFLKAFPRNKSVRLYLSADTLFPSDEYKSTEERLKAYGLEDPRIIPVHFEERDAYIRRLQQAGCFVTCARSEGWNLPLIEAMACGIPSIASDFGGSTEYAGDALVVRIRELRKPHGIYGNWDVPGQWGEPDYDHLVELMKDAYKNYAIHREKALKTSDMIRTKFSWEAAAKKAYAVLEELSSQTVQPAVDPEAEIRAFARSHGFDIKAMEKMSILFSVDCHPTTQDRMDTLIETTKQVRELGYPILITSHVALPPSVVELADFYIYDKNDILSGDDKPIYTRIKDGVAETVKSSIPCHALAGLHNWRNAVDFALGKYEWLYHMNSDCEVDLNEWIRKVRASSKPVIVCLWDNDKQTFGGQIVAAKVECLDKIYPKLKTWDEFREMFKEDRFCSERGFYKIAVREVGLENIEFLDISLGNRFDQVDRDAWPDDLFQCHFVEGPFLQIAGISNREYDVTYSNPVDGSSYVLKQKAGMWSRPSTKYFRDWTVKASLNGEEKYRHHFDLSGKNVIISMGSKALGDTLAWMPYVEEFRKKHNCTVYCSSWWNGIMDYPEIKFVQPGDQIAEVYASYNVGCFDDQPAMNPVNWRLTPLQKVAADILGVEYKPLRARLKYEPYKPKGNGNPPKPYVCFSEFSTMQNKLWNRPGAWQNIIDYLNSLGYDCVSISTEASALKGIVRHNGQSIEQTLTDVSGCEFYIGLNAGPSWLAVALDRPLIMITGVAEGWNDFPNPYRVSSDVCRPGCFNDPSLPIDRGWEWCPRKKDYACTREITEEMVITQINAIRKERASETHKHEDGKTKKVRRAKAGSRSVQRTGVPLGAANPA